jgi:large subunit ribosomal protein L25
MEFAKVNVEIRTTTGKGSARVARRKGHIPAVLYGRRAEPVALMVETHALAKAQDKQRRRNTVFQLKVTGPGATADDVIAMIREVQTDPLTRQPLHVDFLRVALDEEVRVTVPLVAKGTPAGVVDGGQLHMDMHALPLAAKPAAIPVAIEVDVTSLKIGMALHMSDLKLAEGLRALIPGSQALASVVAPREEKVEAPAAAAAATAAEGAAAAAPSAGDKAAGDKAAAAPAAGKKEEKKK